MREAAVFESNVRSGSNVVGDFVSARRYCRVSVKVGGPIRQITSSFGFARLLELANQGEEGVESLEVPDADIDALQSTFFTRPTMPDHAAGEPESTTLSPRQHFHPPIAPMASMRTSRKR